MAATPRALVEKHIEAWGLFREAVERLGPERLEQRTYGGWTAKELVSHVAFWDEAIFGFITTAVRGKELPEGWSFTSGYVPAGEWPSADQHNAREAEWARNRPASEVIERLLKAHETAVATLEGVSDEEISKMPRYFASLAEHYKEHLAELEALLDEDRR